MNHLTEQECRSVSQAGCDGSTAESPGAAQDRAKSLIWISSCHRTDWKCPSFICKLPGKTKKKNSVRVSPIGRHDFMLNNVND